MDVFDRNKYLCFRVQNGPKYISVVGLSLSGFMLTVSVFVTNAKLLLECLINVILYGSLLAAALRRRSRWYLPYLLANAVLIGFKTLGLIGLLAMMSSPAYAELLVKHMSIHAHFTSNELTNSRVALAVAAVVTSVEILLTTWFEHIVYAAYRSIAVSEEYNLNLWHNHLIVHLSLRNKY